MSANTGAMIPEKREVYAKASSYVDREPYRAQVTGNLTRTRFLRATKRNDLSSSEALKKLAQPRATDRRIIDIGLYLTGMALILLPGGPRLMRSDGVRRFRRGIATLIGFRVP
jgi:hypothetical protein